MRILVAFAYLLLTSCHSLTVIHDDVGSGTKIVETTRMHYFFGARPGEIKALENPCVKNWEKISIYRKKFNMAVETSTDMAAIGLTLGVFVPFSAGASLLVSSGLQAEFQSPAIFKQTTVQFQCVE